VHWIRIGGKIFEIKQQNENQLIRQDLVVERRQDAVLPFVPGRRYNESM
jgi:hypothetical protein